MKMNEDGFTLIETLLVLMITSILLLFPVLSIQRVIESKQLDLYFRELTPKITQRQTHAILHNQTTDIKFNPQTNMVYFRIDEYTIQDNNLGETWENDSPYYDLSRTDTKEFAFKKGTGNITKSNRIDINTTKGKYELVYLMGSGRFEIRKR